ncbi:hypothetical protein CLOP_g11903 [Closterium sp. NIES-67]|nr:hypothetical protein CLOP_g11903 [Closterium sp. NIES-67]
MRQVNAADMLEDAIEYIRHLQRQMEAVRLLHPNVRVEPFVSRLDSQQGAARADDAGEDGRDWGLGERGDGGEQREMGRGWRRQGMVSLQQGLSQWRAEGMATNLRM